MRSLGFLLGLTLASIAPAKADGLLDLKGALADFKATTPLSAQLSYAIAGKNGDDSDIDEENGEVSVFFSYGDDGMHLVYQPQVLEAIEVEAQLALEDEDAETPVTNALRRIDPRDAHRMVSAAENMLRRLSEAEFVGEELIEFEGQARRQLNFKMPLESMIKDARTRKYVKRFESDYHIVIDDEGVPLFSEMNYSGKGRAYLVIRVEAFGSTSQVFEVVGNRLVEVKRQSTNGYDTTFGEGENSETRSLALIDEPTAAVAMVGQ